MESVEDAVSYTNVTDRAQLFEEFDLALYAGTTSTCCCRGRVSVLA
jgi:hypothetical protein